MKHLRFLARPLVALLFVVSALAAPAVVVSQTWAQLVASAVDIRWDPSVQVGSGEVGEGQAVFRFNVEGGGLYTLEVVVTEIMAGIQYEDDDSVLFVFSEDGYLLAENDDGPYGYASLINGADLSFPGYYYAVVTTHPRFVDTDDVGRYAGFTEPGLSRIRFDLVIEYGVRDLDWDDDWLDGGGPDDWDFDDWGLDLVYGLEDVFAMARSVVFRDDLAIVMMNIEAGIAVAAIDVAGPAYLAAEVVLETGTYGDSILALFDSEGYMIALDDDSGEEYASLIEDVYLPGPGRYYLVVSSYPNYPETDWGDYLIGYSDYAEEYFPFTLLVELY